MEGTPSDKVDVASLFAGKKGVLFAVPGAFTPGCSKVCIITFKMISAQHSSSKCKNSVTKKILAALSHFENR